VENILNIDPKVLFLQTMAFIALVIVFRVFLFKPVMDVLDARRAEVDSGYKNAEDRLRDAQELKAEYQRHMAEVEEETRAKITEALKQGQSMRDEIISDSRAKADEILGKAQEEIRREKESALTELRTKVADLAVGAAGKIIDERLDEAKHRDLVSRFIDDLGSLPK